MLTGKFPTKWRGGEKAICVAASILPGDGGHSFWYQDTFTVESGMEGEMDV